MAGCTQVQGNFFNSSRNQCKGIKLTVPRAAGGMLHAGLAEAELTGLLSHVVTGAPWTALAAALMQTVESHPCAGLDIGCGANCIYPLLGAAINSWRFVAVDVTQLALEQAAHNVALNPHLAHLITVRPSNVCNAALPSHAVASSQAGQQQQPTAAPAAGQRAAGSCNAAQASGCGHAGQQQDPAGALVSNNKVAGGTGMATFAGPQGSGVLSVAGAGKGQLSTESRVKRQSSGAGDTGQQTAHERSAGCSRQSAPSPGLAWDAGSTDGILLPAVLPGETFSFSMCNPPFFSSMAEAGLNPSTAHGGGHRAFGATVQHVIAGALLVLWELAASEATWAWGRCCVLHPVVLPCLSGYTSLPQLAAAWPCRPCRHPSQCPPLPPPRPAPAWGLLCPTSAPVGKAGIAVIGCLHFATGVVSGCLSDKGSPYSDIFYSPTDACACRHSC